MERKRKKTKTILVMILCFLMVAGLPGELLTQYNGDTVYAATTIKMSKKNVSMTPATQTTLKLNGAASGVKWSSSKSSVAAVDSKGVVTAKKKGTAIIKATYKKITYQCTVTVEYGTKSVSGIKYKDTDGTFYTTGRWYNKTVGGTKRRMTNTGGGAFYFKITGSKYVTINFATTGLTMTPYYAYSIDGKTPKRKTINSGKISLGNAKTHYVRIIVDALAFEDNKWGAEAGVGVKSIKPNTKTGVVTAVKPVDTPVIAFYGDSITEGTRTLNWNLDPRGTSATNSYAWYCARELNAIPYFAGYSSTGITETGYFSTAYNAATRFSASRKVSSYTADVIVVEHGTNDVHTDAATFTSGYKKLLKKLHSQNPKAKIIALIPLNNIHKSEIKTAANSYSWCVSVSTSSWGIAKTEGIHPSAKGAKTMGKKLASKIKKYI